jgi:hypothetical protein
VENSQVAVYLSYAGRGGHALIDRELYLPRSWVEDKERCAATAAAWLELRLAERDRQVRAHARQPMRDRLHGALDGRWCVDRGYPVETLRGGCS